jgi:hypothetical protein
MVNTDSVRTVPLGFRALDPTLPLLAAQVAAEIDNVIVAAKHGHTSLPRIEALPQLANMLAGFQGVDQQGAHIHGMLDPITENVFLRAYQASFDGSKLTDNLAAAAERLAESFSQAEQADSATTSASTETLTHLRDFCLALSNYAASKRRAVFGSRVRHPFSR